MKTGNSAILGNSILWAAAMIGAAILLKDSGYYESVFLLLFTLWMGSFLMIQDSREAMACEWRAIRKFFHSLRKI